MKSIFTLTILLLTSCSSFKDNGARELASTKETHSHLEMVHISKVGPELRSGYFLEEGELKGCALYLQGLGDSIRNHTPFFKALNQAGYRVISFDYMGQGGSEGRMNKTRVSTSFPPDVTAPMLNRYRNKGMYYEIGHQAQFIWDKYKGINNSLGQNCENSKKLVIGWSTGGLAAYKMAKDLIADAVVLIAPGIHVKTMIGEADTHPAKLFLLQDVITERTLTRNKYINSSNPHLDPVKPTSPAHIPQFSGNLYLTSKRSQTWKISDQVPGIVFLSGVEDTYVDRDKTIDTISKNAAHFSLISYEGALHELDNELTEVTEDLYSRTIRFLDRVTQ